MRKFFAPIVLVLIASAGVFTYKDSFNEGRKEIKNVILIGWDGAQRNHMYELLDDGKLPYLSELIKEGSLVEIDVTTGATHTKPGWAEILTGYGPDITGVYSNFDYKPIPQGYTIFERLEEYFGEDNIVTMFIGGKINNLGARGPHKICTNCVTRDIATHKKTEWWKETTEAPARTISEERIFEEREGEPYYYTKETLDVFLVELGRGKRVVRKSISYLEEYKDQRFFAFFHFEEPDEEGHIYGENSEEYENDMMKVDRWLGEIVSKLKEVKIYKKTAIYVTSDHGFDEDSFHHANAPYIFLATNSKEVTKNGDRKDITPTILEDYGVDIENIFPPLDGTTLYERE